MRHCRHFPATLVMVLLLTVVVTVMLFLQAINKSDDLSGDEKAKLKIGIVGTENSGYLKTGFSMLQTVDSSGQAVQFSSIASKDEALKALKDHELDAVILIPDGLLTGLLSGDTSGRLTLYLENAGGSVAPLLLTELTMTISDIIMEMENASYALYDFYTISGVTSIEDINAAQTDLLLVSLKKVLDRKDLFTFSKIHDDSSLSIQSYYLCAVIVFMIHLAGVICASYCIRKDDSIPTLLRIRGLGSPGQTGAEFIALILHRALLTALFVAIMGAALIKSSISFSELSRLSASFPVSLARLALAAYPLILSACALDLMLYELSDSLLSGLLLHFLSVIALSYLSGIFFPISSFPQWIQPFSRLLPLSRAMDYLKGILNQQGYGGPPLISLLLYTLVFLTAAAALRLRRTSG